VDDYYVSLYLVTSLKKKKGKAKFPILLVNVALTTVVDNQVAHIINPVNQ
jgi:hypothetical protein